MFFDFISNRRKNLS